MRSREYYGFDIAEKKEWTTLAGSEFFSAIKLQIQKWWSSKWTISSFSPARICMLFQFWNMQWRTLTHWIQSVNVLKSWIFFRIYIWMSQSFNMQHATYQLHTKAQSSRRSKIMMQNIFETVKRIELYLFCRVNKCQVH